MKTSRFVGLAIGTALLTVTTTYAQVIIDGGFESFPVVTYAVPTTFGAWANQGIVAIDDEIAHGGLQSLSLLPGSFIFQDIPTLPGVQYELTFWNCFHGAPPPIDSTLVSLGGVGVGTAFPAGANVWAGHSYTFTATDTTTRLGLGAMATMQLDDVQVTAVPEPGATLLLLLGAGTVFLIRRRATRRLTRCRSEPGLRAVVAIHASFGTGH